VEKSGVEERGEEKGWEVKTFSVPLKKPSESRVSVKTFSSIFNSNVDEGEIVAECINGQV
jgi:hypothetical protein